MEINKKLIQELYDKAVVNPRLRQNFDLRTSSEDKSQRMLNALLPGTKVDVHRHPQSSETVVCLCGKMVEVFFEEVSVFEKEFVYESSIEDFCDLTGADVVVSTIHKSKGREFDDVYMLLTEPRHITDDELRRYYVGMTRAKQRLFIHANFSLFDRLPADMKTGDQHLYEMPDEIVLQLSHRDVNLGFFKSRKKEILSLRSGEKLRFSNNYLYDTKTNLSVVQLSQKMQNELLVWEDKGYEVTSATIRFIVAWRPKDAPKDEKEHAVLLVDLELAKS